MPDGVACRCIHSWTEADGSRWCCNNKGRDGLDYSNRNEPKAAPSKFQVFEGSKPATDEAEHQAQINKHIAALTEDFGRAPSGH